MRFVLTRARHGLLLAALLCVLLARAAVPAGWMPMADARGRIVLAPCSGMGAMKMASRTVHAPHAMPGMAMHGAVADNDDDRHHPDPGGDHPCSGAGMSVALEHPAFVLPRVPGPPVVAMPLASVAVTTGHGLAAPPPPQTGPPILV